MKGDYVGHATTRFDARDKVLGEALYPGDVIIENAYAMKLRYAERPHARALSVDTSAALSLPGVVAVFTAKDVPFNAYGLQIPDQPVLCGPGSSKEGGDIVRWVGDQVAVVVAETEDIAAHAVSLIQIEYEDLPVITDPRESLKPGALLLHPQYNEMEAHPELVFEGNLICRHRIQKGDVDAAFAFADVVIESEYEIPGQEHAYLQPEAGAAYLDEQGRITVIVGGQWAHEDRQQIAQALMLDEEQVRVIYPAIGGAFGGREDMSVQIVLALAVHKLRHPITITWSREESIVGHHKRHRAYAKVRWAANRDGTLLAAESHVLADAGAYIYTTNKVMGNLVATVNGPYKWPNVKTEVLAAYTNNTPGGAFRGFGAPQANFIAESQMNKLAEALEIDPVEIRLRNLVSDGDPMPWGKPLTDDARGLRHSLTAAAKAVGWRKIEGKWTAPSIPARPDDPAYLKRAPGIAVAIKNVGYSFGYPDHAWAGIELHGGAVIEKAIVYAASSDVGQGTRTVIRQMAAEALNVDLDIIDLCPTDTSIAGSAGSCSASRMTFMIGNTIRGAAETALAQWEEEQRPVSVEYTYYAPKTTTIDRVTGYGHPNFSYGYAAVGVEIAVDTLTGQCHFPKVACANDVGQAINPRLLEGQIEGGVIQALGWAMTENFVEKDGHPLSNTLSTYLIPTIQDIPDVLIPIIIENEEPNGPWGARGMGEMPFIPVASAIHHAVRNATGAWCNKFPFTPERVLRALKGKD